MILMTLIILATTRTSSTTATITWSTIPYVLKLSLVLHNAGLVTGFLAMIKTMISTTVIISADTMMYNPFAGGCKVVVEFNSIIENMLHFGNGSFRRRRTIGWCGNEGTWGEVIFLSWVLRCCKTVLKSSLLHLAKPLRMSPQVSSSKASISSRLKKMACVCLVITDTFSRIWVRPLHQKSWGNSWVHWWCQRHNKNLTQN